MERSQKSKYELVNHYKNGELIESYFVLKENKTNCCRRPKTTSKL